MDLKSNDCDMKIFLHLRKFKSILLPFRLKKNTYIKLYKGNSTYAVVRNEMEKQISEFQNTDLGVQRQAIQHHLAECSHPTLVFFSSALHYRQ